MPVRLAPSSPLFGRGMTCRGSVFRILLNVSATRTSPLGNSANQVAGCSGNIFRFRYAAVDQRATGAFPDLSHHQRAVFSHDSAEMLDGGGSCRFTNQFG